MRAPPGRVGWHWLGIALALLGLARAFLLVAHEPVMGYGNQYDMVRSSACTGLYPVGEDFLVPTPAGPIATYRAGGARHWLCYRSTETALDAAVILAARWLDDTDLVRLRWIGLTKLALLSLTVLLVAGALHRHGPAALLHGAIVLMVLADPVVTLWLNTLYTEFAATWGAYAVIASACALALTPRWAPAMWLVLASGAAGLAFSREQYILLAPALVAASAPWLWARSRALACTVLAVALASSLVSLKLARPEIVAYANRADAYMGLVLPASSSPAAALEVLGLPARCLPAVGATWYTRGDELRRTCPEVARIPSTAFLRFATAEPAVLARSVARVLPMVQPLSDPSLGVLEGEPFTHVDGLAWWARSALKEMVDRVPLAIFVRLVLASPLAALFALLAAIAWARPRRGAPAAASLLAMLLGGTVVYALLTTVFGDGLGEAARHFMIGSLALWSGILALAVWAGSAALRYGRGLTLPAAGRIAVPAAAVIAAIAIEGAVRWSEGQPLAIAGLGPVATIDPRGATLEGWALDPSGVAAVEIRVGDIERQAKYGLASEDVKATFPSYPHAERSRFALPLTASDILLARVRGVLPVRVRVRNHNGAVTEVDRRTLDVGS